LRDALNETASAKRLLGRGAITLRAAKWSLKPTSYGLILKRWRDLRTRVTDTQAHEALEQLIKELEERLRKIGMVANDR
jgi:hypothetical protein